MSGAITESILTISVILVAATTAAAMMHSIYDLDKINYALLDTTKQSISTSFKVIFATNSSENTIKLWVKNVGLKEVDSSAMGKLTLFVGPRGNVRHIPFNNSGAPYWIYTIVNDLDSDSYIDPGETVEIIVDWGMVISYGDWYLRLTTPYGVSTDYTFSVGG
ncbi:MAG: flagellin [Candidatus Methanomethyliaceae archaeon]|nr:flagellin [Candidatus Methanomethyliaceae archaeon]